MQVVARSTAQQVIYTVSQTNSVTSPSIHWNSALAHLIPQKFLLIDIVKQFFGVI
jgi:hypothetical protein